MKKLLFLLFIPFFLFISCVNTTEENYNTGYVSINHKSFRAIEEAVDSDSSLDSLPIELSFKVINNLGKVQTKEKVSTTFGKLGNETLDFSLIPFAKGLKLSLDIIYNGNAIYTGISEAFDLNETNPNVEIFLNLERNSFSIDYNLGKNESLTSIENASTIYTFDSLITLPGATGESKNFLGWYKIDGKEKKSVKTLGRENTFGNVELYPLWDNVEYTISYDTNIKDKVIPSVPVGANHKINNNELPFVEKEGYLFKGWFLQNEYKVEEGYIVKDDIHLCAKYSEIGSTEIVEFTPKNNSENTTLLDSNERISLSTESDTANIYYTIDGSDPFTSTTTTLYSSPFLLPKDNLTIKAYAKHPNLKPSIETSCTYKLKEYKIRILNEDGITEASSFTKKSGELLTETDLQPLANQENKEFSCWLFNNSKVLPGYKVTSDMDLLPSWNEKFTVQDVIIEDNGSTITLKTDTPNATIYYTVDGTSPFDVNGTRTEYKAPITITDNVKNILCYATFTGMKDSRLTSHVCKHETFTVTFDSKGKGKTPSPITGLKKGDKLPSDAITPLTENGYTFENWIIDSGTNKGQVLTEAFTVSENTIISAKWNINTYNINLTNKDGTKESLSYTVNDLVILPEKKLNGYNFDGYFTSKGEKISVIKKGSTENFDLTLKYTPISYNINYANIENVPTNYPSSYTIESDVIQLPKPTKTNYNFDGWYTTKDFTPTTKKETINPKSTGDLVLYASWISLGSPSPVTFDKPEGFLDWGDTITLSTSSSNAKIYYTTDGLDPKTSSTKTLYDETKPITFKPTTNDTLIVKAYSDSIDKGQSEVSVVTYKLKKYTVSFDTKGKGSIPSPITVHKNETIPQASLNPLQCDGWVFVNWTDKDGMTVDTSYLVTKDTVVNANWVLLTDGNIPDVTVTPPSGLIELNDNIKVTHSNSNAKLYFSLHGEDPRFNGYKYDLPYTQSIIGDQTFKLCVKVDGVFSNIINANYTVIKHKIFFDNKGKGGPTPDTLTAANTEFVKLPTIEEKGYTFNGWLDTKGTTHNGGSNYTVSKSDEIFKASWTPITYNITYNVDGGTNPSSNPSTYTIEDDILLSDPTKEGYRFLGWYTDSKFSDVNKVTTINKGSSENKTLYAKWEKITYKITYSNAEVPSDAVISFDIDTTSSITLKDPLPRTGFTFAGWFTDSKMVTNRIETIDPSIRKDYYLYAKWTINTKTSDVIYSVEPTSNSATIDNGTKIILSSQTPGAKIYYTLDGKDPTDINSGRKEYLPDTNITLTTDTLTINAYATSDNLQDSSVTSKIFNMKKYTVYFEDKYTNTPYQEVGYNQKVTLPTSPIRERYNFIGWIKTKGESPETEVLWNFDTDVVQKESITLTAKWEPISYKINFYANSVEGLTDKPLTYFYEDSFISPNNSLSTHGYTFKYTTVNDGTGDVYEQKTMYNIAKLVKENKFDAQNTLNLYAQYKPISYQVYLDEDGDTVESNPNYTTYSYDEVFILPTYTTKSGHKLVSKWKNQANGEIYNAGSSVKNLASNEGDKVTLSAIFTGNVTNVAFTQNNDNVVITWKDPLDKDLSKVSITYYPDTPPSPIEVLKGVQTATIHGLKKNINYVFTVTCVDTAFNNSSGVKCNYYGLNQTVRELSVGTPGSVGNAGDNGPDSTLIRYVTFGDWPQTRKAESVKILDESKVTTKINGWDCYLGSDNGYYVKKKFVKDSKYQFDTAYGAKFPDGTNPVEGKDYYFKIEPITWRILDTKYGVGGNYLLLSEKLHYCGPYSKANSQDYANSDIRHFFNGLNDYSHFKEDNSRGDPSMLLNGFTQDAQNKIIATKLTDSSSVTDRIFALSKTELQSYGLRPTNDKIYDKNRESERTDYTAVIGAKWDVDGLIDSKFSIATGEYWTRTPALENDPGVDMSGITDKTHEMHYVTVTGKLGSATRTANVYYTCYRPALVVSSSSLIPAK